MKTITAINHFYIQLCLQIQFGAKHFIAFGKWFCVPCLSWRGINKKKRNLSNACIICLFGIAGKRFLMFHKGTNFCMSWKQCSNCWSIILDEDLGSWTTWSACSATCGGGTRTRLRNCDLDTSESNEECAESDSQTCNTHKCYYGKKNWYYSPKTDTLHYTN